MKIAYFTERPYRWVPEDVVLKNKAYFAIPNTYFDRQKGSDDYNHYLDEACYAEEMGFDAVCLNEHHGNPFCMGNVLNVEAAILARITKKVKIVLIGNPLPVIKHPLRMAEELAEIDLISRGRLVTGWVRGAGSEQYFNNANPAYNREMFNEAHDFIIQAWTKPGPWRYEGKHFHFRHVNPWALPFQEPHPQMWIPGVLSPETVLWCADHAYPYIGLGTSLGPTCDLWDFYAEQAAQNGYQAGPENFGYLVPTFVAETEEKAQKLGRGFVYGGGQNAFSAPQYTLPPGYNSKNAIRNLAKQPGGSWLGINREKMGGSEDEDKAVVNYDEVRKKLTAGFEKGQRNLQLLIGTPKSIIPKVKQIMDVIRPGTFTFFAVQGQVSNEDRLNCIRLLGQEVIPEVREYAKKIGLTDPFERKTGSVKLTHGTKRGPVVDREALKLFKFEK